VQMLRERSCGTAHGYSDFAALNELGCAHGASPLAS
jgi:hypothetical protein